MISNGHKIYNSFEEELKPHWEKLFSKGKGYNTSFCWCKLWWEKYSSGNSLYIYTFWENKKLKLLAPFYLCDKRVFLIGTRPDTYDEFNILCEDPKYLDKLVDHLTYNQIDLGFKHLNSNCELAKKFVNKFSSLGIFTITQITETKPRILNEINRESAIRSDVKRCEKNLNKDMQDEYAFEFSVDKGPDYIEEFAEFHKERWNGGMLVKKKKLEDFVKDVYFQDTNMHLSRLYIRKTNETAAYCYGYIDSASTYWLSMTAYNPKYKKYAPGKVILYKLINELKEKNISSFDFGRGSEKYKTEFSDYQDIMFNFYSYKNDRKYVKIRNFIDKILKLFFKYSG